MQPLARRSEILLSISPSSTCSTSKDNTMHPLCLDLLLCSKLIDGSVTGNLLFLQPFASNAVIWCKWAPSILLKHYVIFKKQFLRSSRDEFADERLQLALTEDHKRLNWCRTLKNCTAICPQKQWRSHRGNYFWIIDINLIVLN